MSNIITQESATTDPGPLLAARLRAERDRRGWSLADLAARSDVSKAMLSKIEREEASPTASILSRIASAFGLTLAALLTDEGAAPKRLARLADQPVWRDPETGYTRRQVYLDATSPLELVDVSLPVGASVSFASSAYEQKRHVCWVLAGVLTLIEGESEYRLDAGDRLEFGNPATVTYRNKGATPCRYLIALLRV
jgi:transcriptional regulator with XRE-family HTH domain